MRLARLVIPVQSAVSWLIASTEGLRARVEAFLFVVTGSGDSCTWTAYGDLRWLIRYASGQVDGESWNGQHLYIVADSLCQQAASAAEASWVVRTGLLAGAPMTFHSILSGDAKDRASRDTREAPAFFADLNLDQIIDSATANKQEYDLKPFFYSPLRDVETILYRHEVMRDLDDAALGASIKSFAEQMIVVRRYLALVEKLQAKHHRGGWFLEAALAYCSAVSDLAQNLSRAGLRSRGLQEFRDYLTGYVGTQEFRLLLAEAQAVKRSLSDLKYSVIIHPGRFSVRKYAEETDYSVEVEKTFERFQQGAVKDYRVRLSAVSGMNHIGAQILAFVARLYPDEFAALDRFCGQHADFVDKAIRVFDREIQFYIAYLDFIADLKRKGLPFCYPQVSATSREVFSQEGFDLALAVSLLYSEQPVVCNDFFLEGPERIIVVSGPNQGGKTTFARMFGQLHYLASLGCPVPGKRAQLFLFDQIHSHFEREEDVRSLTGKLGDDLIRIHDILGRTTPNSILILNEIFASTTLQDAVFLCKEIMAKVINFDLLCVWVTFIDELSMLSEKTVSMVSTVAPDNPAVRTFKIVRKPADGLAYALSIAEKHRVTYQQIKERIKA